MLKIWKQAWKRQSLRTPQIGCDSDQDAQLSGACDGLRTSLDATATAPSGTGASVQVPVENVSARKRSKTEDPATDALEHPAKRPKSEDSNRDSIGNHLPEMEEENLESRRSRMYAEIFEDEIMNHAKRENTIGVITSVRSVTKIFSRFLEWAVQAERSRPVRNMRKVQRTALVIVDDDASVDNQANDLTESCILDIGTYTESIRGTDNPWSILLQRDVVVVPANGFLDSLLRGRLAITQIHALLTSEAQFVKDQDQHPMMRVMDEFYRVTDPLSRPRIFAIVTPPSDRKFHYDSGMLKLENALDAKVFGVSGDKRTEILALPDRPSEVLVLYNPPSGTTETQLFKRLLQLDPQEAIFPRLFGASRLVLAELGSCASDLVWRGALKEIEANVTPVYEEDEDGPDQHRISTARAKVKMRDLVKNWEFAMPNLHQNSKGFNVTPKFLKLVHVLKSCEPYGEGFRGVVFVQRRATAIVMVDLLRTLGDHIGFIRPHAVVGHGVSADPARQQGIFRAFGKGTYNLLIATKAAEDLDIPKACTVIRFDLFESHVSNAYVRSRTRGRESHLLFMVERGNDAHRRILAQVTQLNIDMRRWTDSVTNTIGSSVPPGGLRETTNAYYSDSEDEDEQETVLDPTTSGRIRLCDATTVIYRFAAKQSMTRGHGDDRLFEYKELDAGLGVSRAYFCNVSLSSLPMRQDPGPNFPTRSLARRHACYQACVELFNNGLLDYTLFPLPPSVLRRNLSALERNADGDKKSAGTRCYPRKQPDFWANTLNIPLGSGLLYPIIVSTDYRDEGSKSYGPMLILTRRPFPHFPDFKIFFSGVSAIIHLVQAAPLTVTAKQLGDLHMYTVRVCRAISNRAFVCPLETMPYFLAPLNASWKENTSSETQFPVISGLIPWELVSLAAKSWVVALQSETVEKLELDVEDAVIQDRWVEFTRRYHAVKIRRDLSPLGKAADSAREADYDNFVEYCKARRKCFEGLKNYDSPMIEVSKVPTLTNRLNPTSRPTVASTKHPAKYLIPELCAKFTIPSSTFRTALLLPSITRRIDELLITKELNATLFDHAIGERHLQSAISAPSAGLEFDYERLELLGDAFLKYLSSIYVFVTNPAQHEGALHIARQRIISNKSLLQNGLSVGLPPFIQAKTFTVRSWHPPNFVFIPSHGPALSLAAQAEPMKIELAEEATDNKENAGEIQAEDLIKPETFMEGHVRDEGHDPSGEHTKQNHVEDLTKHEALTTGSPHDDNSDSRGTPTRPPETKKSKKKRQQDEQNRQHLGDKSVADVVEAIIGAAYISGGRGGALKASKALKIPIPNVDRWSDFGRKALAPPPAVTAKLRPGSIEAVEKIIGHPFARPHLLAQALTHSSIPGHETISYERLEFIGDAILEFMVIRHIFDRDVQLSPGALTLLKGAMVSNSALAAVCVSSGLHEHILFDSFTLASTLQSYIDNLKSIQAKEYELAEKEGRSSGQYWLEIEPPKALSDVVESIIGAIYISEHFSPIGAEALFDNILKPFYDRHITLKTLSHHPTKILFELFQAQGCQSFEITKEKDDASQITRCDVVIHEVILASAIDATSTIAARMASLFALDALEGDADFITRTCDCRTHSRKAQAKNTSNEMFAAFAEEVGEKVVVEESV